MHNNVASEIVDAGVAIALDKPILMDKLSNVVSTKKTPLDSLSPARLLILVMQ